MKVLSILGFCLVVFSTQVFASDLPEWDGVYLRYQDNSFEELKPVSSVRMNFSPRGVSYYSTSDYTIIPSNRFKGIFVKGVDLIGKVSFYPMNRDREMSLSDLFRSKKENKFLDRFTLKPNPGFYTPRKRPEGADGLYFEPSKEALQFFGSAEEGYFVQLVAGNGTYFIFGIGANTEEAQDSMQQATAGDVR
ncbi:MAG: hypothetical protein EHM79_17935 [Geobacter sp.]|nr:MAG: hypothetical protein EHM79_17935 [Geobacter sp.]